MSDYGREAIVDAAIAASASKAMYTGGGIAGTAFVLDNFFFGVIGALLAFGGFVVNLYYRRRDDRRLQAFHDLKMAQMARRGDDE